MTHGKTSDGKPYVGNPHVWFDGGKGASAAPRRGSLHYAIKLFLLVLGQSAAFVAGADNLPFWGDAEPATNRTSASSQTVALASEFESRICAGDEVALATFDSRPVGAILMIR